ncbi:cyclopentanone monooxygenase [Lophiostoma macrostomum CBS 122681]|uniref:Cyclopentanone monooxygenase n=1 Tax=Lophiostoma macrostomum CBS 122681 TaxID=1314788 RepID=A0A6A6STG9_9PLEO|nr:cyclopentanone monooxygenase [Lophiostoma macrostomum CBS 122681]
MPKVFRECDGANGTNGHSSISHYDIIIIGGGFGGCYSLHKFRELGFACHVFESGSALGGVWHWNGYPGARVDSEIPYYQFSLPKVWKTWNWSQRFPAHEELKRYFEHVDEVLDLSRDISFNSIVNGADFDTEKSQWTVTTNKGDRATCRFLVPATGSSHKRYEPNFPDMKRYSGQLIHSASWPKLGVDFAGKKVAIIGAGATGIQCVQEISKLASSLTNYIRNPNIALPMRQRPLTNLEQTANKAIYNGLFQMARNTAAGLAGDPQIAATYEHTPEQREELWEELYARGAFNYQAANYRDYLVDEKANIMLYDFWLKKTRERVKDLKKQAIVAPTEPPYPFATKRSSLENDYYECIDRDNVSLVNLKDNPIQAFTENSIKTQDGEERDFDIVILATGYDNMTGSLTSMGLRGKDGVDMRERWSDGVRTYLGITASGCPNMFMIFGPQAPTAFTNAPVFIEMQVEFVAETLARLRDESIYFIETRPSAEEQWNDIIQDMSSKTLFRKATSWYMGSNIPGKKREQLNYIGGIKGYMEACRNGLKDWSHFDVLQDEKCRSGISKEQMPVVR